MDYIKEKRPSLSPLYGEICNKRGRGYFRALEEKAKEMARRAGCPFFDNKTPPGVRAQRGHPLVVDYFFREEVRGTENSGEAEQVISRQSLGKSKK